MPTPTGCQCGKSSNAAEKVTGLAQQVQTQAPLQISKCIVVHECTCMWYCAYVVLYTYAHVHAQVQVHAQVICGMHMWYAYVVCTCVCMHMHMHTHMCVTCTCTCTCTCDMCMYVRGNICYITRRSRSDEWGVSVVSGLAGQDLAQEHQRRERSLQGGPRHDRPGPPLREQVCS